LFATHWVPVGSANLLLMCNQSSWHLQRNSLSLKLAQAESLHAKQGCFERLDSVHAFFGAWKT
jgi:hypothetical protein